MSLVEYSAYLDSNIQGINRVPAHWSIKRIRHIATLNPSKSEVDLDSCTEVSFLPMESIGDDGRLKLDSTRPIREVSSGYTYFRNGDVVLAKITPCFENGKGAIASGLTKGIGFGTTELIVVRPHPESLSPNFLQWLFLSAPFRKNGEAEMFGAGGQKRVPDDYVLNYYFPLPPLPEQRAIAAFLDAETSKIDALVAEQRRLIELLKEKRQAVISHAVTKGLNPHVKMKPSGIDWLSDIPEHWEMKALKHLGTICYGIGEPPTYYDEGVPLIRATNVRSGALTPVGLVFVKPEQIPSQRIVWLRSGDIIVVRSGAGTGDSAIIPENYGPAIAGFDMVFQVRFASPWYVQYSLLSDFVTKAQLDIVKTRAAQPHLNAQELGSCLIALPPRTEQEGIVQYLSERVHEFNELEKSAEKAVALLQERRTALISAAVTGKIDVRGFVPKEASA